MQGGFLDTREDTLKAGRNESKMNEANSMGKGKMQWTN
jgi:hypothetical protein